jgi:ParB-like chromosome segregation protein Spo0J
MSEPPRIEMRPVADLVGNQYQPYPPMGEGELKALIQSISTEGFRPTTPIVTDEHGAVLCGHQRLLAAQQLRLAEVPTITLAGLSEADKWKESLRDNAARRQTLSAEARKAIARNLLQHFPYWSDRSIAADAGLSPTLIKGLRQEVKAELSTVDSPVDSDDDQRVGRDGKVRRVPQREPKRLPTETLRVWVTTLMPKQSPEERDATVLAYNERHPDEAPDERRFEEWTVAWLLGQRWRRGPKR